MYSVLILNQKSMVSFSQYRPIFADALNNNRIGVCKWTESGTTIETALPELGNLTDDKTEWRAIIVRYIDDAGMSSFESDAWNPYDFLINKDGSDVAEESPIPLVRLTQMLGGVPPLEVEFKPEVIKEPHRAPRTIYVPVENPEREARHKNLIEKYRYDGKLPSALMIISLRSKKYQEEGIGRSWLSHKESESSEFWKRNNFPSMCRFMAYDYDKQGPVQREADDFGFWYSVMLMAENKWDSGTIQAYRVYSLVPHFDKEAMTESFQNVSDKLRKTKDQVEKSINEDLDSQYDGEGELPYFDMDVPVPLNLPKTSNFLPNENSFGLLSRGANNDTAIWAKQRKKAEDELAFCVRTAERALDMAADRTRPCSVYTEEEVSPLNKYQEEDIQREVDELYDRIEEIRMNLPSDKVNTDKKIVARAESVFKKLLGRVMFYPAIVGFISVALLVMFASIPALIDYFQKKSDKILSITYYWIIFVGLIFLFALVVLLVQKIRLSISVRRYNSCLQNSFDQLQEKASDYSNYMSDIVSHSRGTSYIDISNCLKNYSNSMRNVKFQHIKAINILYKKINSWSKAYHLNVNFKRRTTSLTEPFNMSVLPAENSLYSLANGEENSLELNNNSGMTLEAPMNYVDRLEIVREELYDDKRV